MHLNHECGSQGMDQHLPTRSVKIGKDIKRVKLTQTESQRGRYICLSHCWVQQAFSKGRPEI